jgi:hypothetical protein
MLIPAEEGLFACLHTFCAKPAEWVRLAVAVRGLPIEPCMPVGVTERKVALTPVLIAKLADLHAQTFQTRMLRVDVIDLNFDVQA